MNNITQKAAEWLISGRLPNEQAIQFWLAMLLVSLDYEVEVEYSVPSGHMDIFLPERRVVIETKALGKVDPNDVRDPDSDETQFAQCERYVREGWERQRGMFDLDALDDLPWKAILTDGRVWWVWQWEIRPNKTLGEADAVVVNQRHDQSAETLVAGVKDLTRTMRQLRLPR